MPTRSRSKPLNQSHKGTEAEDPASGDSEIPLQDLTKTQIRRLTIKTNDRPIPKPTNATSLRNAIQDLLANQSIQVGRKSPRKKEENPALKAEKEDEQPPAVTGRRRSRREPTGLDKSPGAPNSLEARPQRHRSKAVSIAVERGAGAEEPGEDKVLKRKHSEAQTAAARPAKKQKQKADEVEGLQPSPEPGKEQRKKRKKSKTGADKESPAREESQKDKEPDPEKRNSQTLADKTQAGDQAAAQRPIAPQSSVAPTHKGGTHKKPSQGKAAAGSHNSHKQMHPLDKRPPVSPVPSPLFSRSQPQQHEGQAPARAHPSAPNTPRQQRHNKKPSRADTDSPGFKRRAGRDPPAKRQKTKEINRRQSNPDKPKADADANVDPADPANRALVPVQAQVGEPAVSGGGRKRKDFLRGNYDRYYGRRTKLLGSDPRFEFFRRAWFEACDVLDLGCNVGNVAFEIAENYGARSVVGLDIDRTLIARARRQLGARLAGAGFRNPSRFPLAFLYDHGPLPARQGGRYPGNIELVAGDYLDNATLAEQRFDTILCLSVTKWVHLHAGDKGLRLMFSKMFHSLREGGLLLLEAQPWRSYKKRFNSYSPQMKENYRGIRLKPEDFSTVLIAEIGFSSVEVLGTPDSARPGFDRPLWLFRKGR